MRILLVGEFSGLHRELKKGLVQLDHEVTILAAGDGWKNLDCDIRIPHGSNLFTKVIAGVNQAKIIKSLNDYDVVQFIYPHLFNRAVNSVFINSLIQNNRSSFLIAAGSDAFYWNDYKTKFRYSPHEENLTIDLKGSRGVGSKHWFKSWNRKMASSVNAIIPVAYDYRIGYNEFRNLAKTLPMPINCADIQPSYFNTESSKIVILHGISRPGFKGSRFINCALDKLKEKFLEKIEVIKPERLTYSEYLNVLRRSDIVVDQALSYSYGMNALLSAAMGKVTLSGAEPECLSELGVEYSPIINILPSVEDIFSKLDQLVSDRMLISKLSIDSRRYVENLHDSKVVANRFISTWLKHQERV